MSETKHTPGPWQARSDHTAEDRLTIIGNVDGEYVDGQPRCTYDVIAVCQDEYGEALPNAEANVRLLIAAPDLLEALHGAKGYLLNAKIDLEAGAPKRTALMTIEGGIKIVEAAIAKAEGRTP